MARAVLLFILGSIAGAQPYLISTFAGGAEPPAFSLATNTSFDAPSGVATDAAGNVYFTTSYCVFKLDGRGSVSRVAGNRRFGYSGDGGPALSAEVGLGGSTGLTVDGQGNLLVSDYTRVRRVSPSGIIATIVGTGAGALGVAFGDGGPATAARLTAPDGLALDGQGNLYIADWNIVRKVSPAGIITTVAGTGKGGFSGDGGPAVTAQLSNVKGLALDQPGNLYIADYSNGRIRRVAPDGTIMTVAGGGTAGVGDGSPSTQATLSFPRGVAVDGQGNLYISQQTGARVRKVSTDGIITTVAGNGRAGFSGDGGPGTSAQLYSPSGIALDGAGNLYIADFSNRRIRKLATDGTITTVAGNGKAIYTGDGGPATAAQFGGSVTAAADAEGNLYVADQGDNVVRKVSPAGIITTVAGNG